MDDSSNQLDIIIYNKHLLQRPSTTQIVTRPVNWWTSFPDRFVILVLTISFCQVDYWFLSLTVLLNSDWNCIVHSVYTEWTSYIPVGFLLSPASPWGHYLSNWPLRLHMKGNPSSYVTADVFWSRRRQIQNEKSSTKEIIPFGAWSRLKGECKKRRQLIIRRHIIIYYVNNPSTSRSIFAPQRSTYDWQLTACFTDK